MVPVLYLARHGATTLNLDNCFRGNANPPLAPEGIRDASILANFFAEQPFSFIVTSDRTRAVQTANIIDQGRGIKIHLTPKLRAFNIGDFSGKPRNAENIEALQYYIDNPDIMIPGGESLNQFRSRIRPAIMEAIELSDEAGMPGLLVAHSSIVHETSNLIRGDHMACLVKPGGAVCIYVQKGKLGMDAIWKPVDITPAEKRADTVS